MAREVWIGIELVKTPSGKLAPVTRGVFTKKVRALRATRSGGSKFSFALPARLNQILPDNYFMEHVEQEDASIRV